MRALWFAGLSIEQETMENRISTFLEKCMAVLIWLISILIGLLFFSIFASFVLVPLGVMFYFFWYWD